MIDTYTDLNDIVEKHSLVVAYRYVSQEPEGLNQYFTQQALMEAFEYEGFKSREDIWEKAIRDFFYMMDNQVTPQFNKVAKTGNQATHYFNRIAETGNMALVNEYGDAFYLSKYTLTKEGIINAEKQLKEIYGDNILSEKPLAEQLGLVEGGTAPASDRIVELDHNSPPYKEAMSALDEVIEAVDNERKNDFEEKERVQKELQAGKTLLSALRVDREKIKATLIETLKWLGKKFVDVAISGLAENAIKTVLSLFGLR